MAICRPLGINRRTIRRYTEGESRCIRPLTSNRAKFFGRRHAKAVHLKAGEEIHVIDPRASRDEAWAYFDLDLEFSRIKKPQAA